jgi:hypothetical protein
MAASIAPASAWNKMWAQVSFRAKSVPFLARARRGTRSSSLSVTRYRLAISLSRLYCSIPREELPIKIIVEIRYTAEQIVLKVEQDSSIGAILEYLLRDLNRREMERFLLKLIPEEYMAELEDLFSAEHGHVLPALAFLFRTAYEEAGSQLQERVAQQYVQILKEEAERLVFAYDGAFFRMSDLQHLSGADAQLVKKHFFARISSTFARGPIGRRDRRGKIGPLMVPCGQGRGSPGPRAGPRRSTAMHGPAWAMPLRRKVRPACAPPTDQRGGVRRRAAVLTTGRPPRPKR